MEKEIFLVEELENRLAIEAVQYMHKVDEVWETNEFEPTYFDTYITGPLYGEFIQAIYDRIKPLNSHEANRFLTLSVAQFKTHTPERREKDFILNYWHTKWFPNPMGDDVSEHDKRYAKHIWWHYTNHFHLYKDAAEKALDDFRKGLIGTPTIQHSQPEVKTDPIKYSCYNIFIKALEYNYPYKTTVLSFKYSMRDNLDYLKKEILNNLILLKQDERKLYLNRLKYEVGNHRQHVWANAGHLEKWYLKYNTEAEDSIFFRSPDNPIYEILMADRPHFYETKEEGFNIDTEQIQDEFFNYYYGYYVEAAFLFIDEQINEVSPNPGSNSLHPGTHSQQPVQAPTTKLKVNITVPQLAYLFKMLNDVKPEIFDIEAKTELSNFIASNFITKATEKEGIKTKSVYNLFSDTDKKVATYWVDILKKMLEDARKV
jgi:hypothetical protein